MTLIDDFEENEELDLAAPEIRAAAHVVLRAGGGQGAVREACEMILRAKGAWRV